ncbi:hypothetical protein SVAN01_02334 [Stagonosporopsis vannaccii]|nr:hypothetical protein SVAN01_02334 [Stagonosporopsis vannaccii]
MRVLCVKDLKFKEFHDMPKDDYAILSHVWGDKEISYNDMKSWSKSEPFSIAGKENASAKLRGCREQARNDGIKYLWIDTCCINKSNYTELTEAINSMFLWYQKSKYCYAYMADVTSQGKNLKNKKWFTRGWTLQELIAPKDVIFFDCDWKKIGNKKKLARDISEITHIPQDFLLGSKSLEEASIAQRMSWASGRTTSKEEDLAYCLFGIFNVHMPLLYGERLKAAFRRLQLHILETDDDTSIFAWKMQKAQTKHVTFELLASTPKLFEGSHDIICAPFPSEVPGYTRGIRTPILFNNKGLHLSLPVRKTSNRQLVAFLGCTRADGANQRCAIKLEDISANGGRYSRFGDLTLAEMDDINIHFKDLTTETKLFRSVEFATEETSRTNRSAKSAPQKERALAGS